MTYHLGINLGHDRAAALIEDGDIRVAIQQERLDRSKHSVGMLLQSASDPHQIQPPWEAIHYCLDAAGITLAEVESITANMPGTDLAPDILERMLAPEYRAKIRTLPSHHLGHAYSAFWPSGFDQAIVLVADATGSTNAHHQTESYTLYHAHDQQLTPLHSEKVASYLTALGTLGFLYEYVARKAGFVTTVNDSISVPEAGKLMGLAAYGGPQAHWQQWIQPIENSYHLAISPYDIFLEVAALEKHYDDGKGSAYLRPYLVDLSWKIQHELEQALSHIVALAMKQTGLSKLCLAGGVALNSVANYTLYRELGLDDLFVFPAAGDAGIAAGCALWAYATQESAPKRPAKLKSAAFGQTYTTKAIEQAVAARSDQLLLEHPKKDLTQRCATALSQGHIVAWFQQGSEYGPRSLGHRSILADPRFARMKDVINARIKFREPFRPFAPVIPEENLSEVFAFQDTPPSATALMLMVAPIKPQYRSELPGISHEDGSGRVQTVSLESSPHLYHLCQELATLRGGPPVILNTSFNVAGQPLVETPEQAIEVFLTTDIDYLVLDGLWISKRQTPILSYAEHSQDLTVETLPQGLAPGQPDVLELMRQLDQALFFDDTEACPWSNEELQRLSRLGGRYKETSRLFPQHPFVTEFYTQFGPQCRLLLDPLGESQLVDLGEPTKTRGYSLDQVKWLLARLNSEKLNKTPASLEQLRRSQQLSTLEQQQQLDWAQKQLQHYALLPQETHPPTLVADSPLPETSEHTFQPFADPAFIITGILSNIRQTLIHADYTEVSICRLLSIDSLQKIEPTHLHYYDHYKLPHNDLGDFIRLFLLRVALPEEHIKQLFGINEYHALVQLGLLIPRGKQQWASRIDLYCVDNLYISTDHRYLLLPEDNLEEEPVMYIGLDSHGLVNTAPRHPVDTLLDLCTGSGVQALVASRYVGQVTGIDINPRALRFARFNAQLNNISNATFIQGNLYQPLGKQRFDIIVANPPFVASPKQALRFRDGGDNGEAVLADIITQAAAHLNTNGRLHIVTDLVDVADYQRKLQHWWKGGPTDSLVLQTADRDAMLFAVPHVHQAFGQRFHDYNSGLADWLDNLQQMPQPIAINFGYILIHCHADKTQPSSYYTRTIHNPSQPIDTQVGDYFRQRQLLNAPETQPLQLSINPHIRFRVDSDACGLTTDITLFSPTSAYYTHYQIDDTVFQALQTIATRNVSIINSAEITKQQILLDLLHKGVLSLHKANSFAASGTSIINLQASQPTSISGDCENAPSPSVIQEQATATTPTCLSSYCR